MTKDSKINLVEAAQSLLEIAAVPMASNTGNATDATYCDGCGQQSMRGRVHTGDCAVGLALSAVWSLMPPNEEDWSGWLDAL